VPTLVLGFLALGVAPCRAQVQADKGPDPAWVHQGELLTKRLQTNALRLRQSQHLDGQLGQQLAAIAQPDENAVARTASENKTLALRLAAFERELATLTTNDSRTSVSIADLQKELTEAEEARDRLAKIQSERMNELASTNGTKGLRRELVLKDLDPITIKLVKNRVVPMMEPFYNVRRGKLKLALTGESVDGVIISRVHDGESAANAIRPGGLLDTLLSNADPKKKYFRLLVCADSVSAFRAIPEVISRRGFAYSWDTANDEDILRPLRKNAEPDQEDRGYFPTK